MSDPDATNKLETDQQRSQTQRQPLAAVRDPQRFRAFLQAAGLSFVALLALGGILLVAFKLQFPAAGAGADPVEILTSLVILSLASLRVPVHIGEVTITILPLGALFATALTVSWACRNTIPAARPRDGIFVGLLFGAVAATAASIFRFRFDVDPVYAGAVGAFFFGTVWASAFASLSLALRGGGARAVFGRKGAALRDRRPATFEGLRAGLLMVALASVLAAAAALLWAIVALIGGDGPDYDHAGHVVAALVYIVAFAPNLIVVVISLGLGAPLQLGAGLTIGGRIRSNVRELSIFDGSVDPMLLLLLIPLLACALAGYWSRRQAVATTHPVWTLTVAAVVFGGSLAVLAALGGVRLGAQLTPERGFGVLAPHVGFVFLLGLLWAGGAGYAGWTIAERRR